VTKEDFIDWKANPVTKAFLNTIADRIGEIKEELAAEAIHADPRVLSAKGGAIQALMDVLDVEFNEESHGD
jgi:hypothetical protein